MHARRVALALALLGLSLIAAVPPGAVPDHGGFPLPDLSWPVGSAGPRWSGEAFRGLPQQRAGDPRKVPHYVPAEATSANRGAGRAVDRGIGATAPYTAPVKRVQPGKTPAISGPTSFDPKTSTKDPAG